MRPLTAIVFHCSASDNPNHDDISVIRKWHKERGWKDVGYHFFVKKNGLIQKGRPIAEIGAHVSGHNSTTIGVCFSGNKEFTPAQMASAAIIVALIKESTKKDLPVKHHRDYTNKKTCPNFVAADFLKGKLTLIRGI